MPYKGAKRHTVMKAAANVLQLEITIINFDNRTTPFTATSALDMHNMATHVMSKVLRASVVEPCTAVSLLPLVTESLNVNYSKLNKCVRRCLP